MDTQSPATKFSVMLIGTINSGRTSILYRYWKSIFYTYPPRLGLDFVKKLTEVGDYIILLLIWDTFNYFFIGSRSDINHIKSASGLLFLFDISDIDSFKKAKEYIERSKDVWKTNSCKILVGNKKDLIRSVSFEDAIMVAKEYNMVYMETSTKTPENIDECFLLLTYMMIDSIS